jgi:hypothetical protein
MRFEKSCAGMIWYRRDTQSGLKVDEAKGIFDQRQSWVFPRRDP